MTCSTPVQAGHQYALDIEWMVRKTEESDWLEAVEALRYE